MKKHLTAVFSSFVLFTSTYADFCDFPTCCSSYSFWESPEDLWFDADYLYWQIKDSPAPPPLVTEGPIVADQAPVLGEPGETVVLGDKSINNSWRSGGRFAIGFGFNNSCLLWYPCFVGAEANYFFLAHRSTSSTVSSDGLLTSPFLAIPFFDVVTDRESSTALAIPGIFPGTGTLKIANSMQGAEFNGLTRFSYGPQWSFSLLAGFRYWNFVEHLSFATSSPYSDNIHAASVFKTLDKFNVNNNFYGGQLGAQAEFSYRQFFCNIKGKIAFGATYEELNIYGKTETNDFASTVQNFSGGYFALPTNIGRHKTTHFAVLPEVDLNVGYEPIECVRLQLGYTFLYVSNMLWAEQQIDRNINPSQAVSITGSPTSPLVGKASPKARLKSGSLWAQGISVGIEFRY